MVFVIIIGFMVLSMLVGNGLRRKFKRYSRMALSAGLSGEEVAVRMLRDHGIGGVSVVSVSGHLTDHYNPSSRTINLSEAVYHGRSVASAAVAAHECGHAIQHAQAYAMLRLRSALVPLQHISARILNFIFIAMLFGAFTLPSLIQPHMAFGIIAVCYGIFTLFAFVTLPVELDASKRALAWIYNRRIVNNDERRMASDALRQAALTYVVAALSSLAMLLYYVFMFVQSRD